MAAYGLASRTKLNGVSVALLNLENPPAVMTSPRRFSPAWAPKPKPTSCERDAGVQIIVDAE